MRILVDTNVYLEFILKREKFEEVDDFLKMVFLGRHQTCISAMSMRDIGYVVHRYTHSEEKAKKMQSRIYQMVTKVVSTSGDAAIDGLYSDITDYEDALQFRAADEAMCDAIVTFNVNDYKNANMPVFTPKQICSIWSKCR